MIQAPGTVQRRVRADNAPTQLSRFPALLGFAPLAVALLVWQFAGSGESASFPVPSTWFQAIGDMLKDGTLLPALGSTVSTFVLGSLLALVVGVPLGIALGSNGTLNRAFGPILDFFRTLPPPVVVSVAGLILGLTFQASVVIVAFSVVWPILLNTVSSTRSVSPVRREMAHSIGLSNSDSLLKVLLPSLLPCVAVGFRIAITTALVVTLLVDLLSSATGIGRLLLERQQTFDASAVWGLLLVIGFVGYLLNVLVGVVERVLFRNWPPQR